LHCQSVLNNAEIDAKYHENFLSYVCINGFNNKKTIKNIFKNVRENKKREKKLKNLSEILFKTVPVASEIIGLTGIVKVND